MDMHMLASLVDWDWPPDASEAILAALRNGETLKTERLLAAELAGEWHVMDDVVAEELLRILGDSEEPEVLRVQAARSLGPALARGWEEEDDEWDQPPLSEETLNWAQTSLRRTYSRPDTPGEVRRQILETSVRYPEAWHRGAVRAAYRDGDRLWRITALSCMRYLPGFGDEIVEALGSGDGELQCLAVEAASDQAVGGAWPYVQDLILSAAGGATLLPGEPELGRSLLVAAMNAVAVLRPLEAHRTLNGLAQSDDEEIAQAALEVLDLVESLWTRHDWDDEEDTTWH